MKEGKDETIEGRLLEFADKLDQFYEAFAELKRGNTDLEFVIMYQTALSKLLAIPLKATVHYFRTEILKDAVQEKTHIDIQTLTNEVLDTKKIIACTSFPKELTHGRLFLFPEKKSYNRSD